MLTDDLTPPSNQDGPDGIIDGLTNSNMGDVGSVNETEPDALSIPDAVRLARDSYLSSSDYLRLSRRKQWYNSLRAYQNLHPNGSKYLSNDFRYRSNLFVPKTRATVRKDESEVASALFSNEDVVHISAANQDDTNQVANAALIQKLVQYHCTKSIKWFMTVVGGAQDCDIMGVAIAKVYWKYSERVVSSSTRLNLTENGLENQIVNEVEIVEDKPAIDLLPPENIRIDSSCDWRDPINTSPYVIELIPMTYGEIRELIDSGKWLEASDGDITSATDMDDNQTRTSRVGDRVAAQNNDTFLSRPNTYKVCWVRSNIVRYKGRDWFYYTTGGSCALLTTPVELKEAFLNGERPYVMGVNAPEAHVAYPMSKVESLTDMQRAINDQTNLRFDNIKLTLSPRQILREGSGIDPNDVRTFMPGKSLFTKDPNADIKWDRPPDITSSAYQEQNILSSLFDDLAGDQTSSGMQTQLVQQSATGQHLISGIASGMTEYELRVFADTFISPIIAKLIKLIQAYEDDETVLALAATNAKLMERFGISEVTDELLQSEVDLKIGIGLGATNGTFRLKKMNEAADTMGKMFGQYVSMGLNFDEVTKEVFGACGFDNGSRFFKPGFDPVQAQQQMAQANQPQQQQQPDNSQEMQIKAQIAAQTNQAKLQTAQINAQTKSQATQAQMLMARDKQQAETHRLQLQHGHELHKNRMAAHVNHAQTFMNNLQQSALRR